MKQMRLLRVITILLVFGATTVLFQNCARSGSGGVATAASTSGNMATSGNGEGYGGMQAKSKYAYTNPGSTCADNGPNSEIDLLENGSYSLVRDNCATLAPPVALGQNLIEILSQTVIVYQGLVYLQIP